MQARLEIQTGRRAGETIAVSDAQAVTVGRTASASFALPEDTFLSRVHFAVECHGSSCRLTDRQSANGTSLNGSKVTVPVMLHDGDVIEAGQTKFLVRIAAEAAAALSPPQPIAEAGGLPPARADHPHVAASQDTLAIGSWFFGTIPEGWLVVEGFGLRRHERNAYPSEVMVSEATLAPGQSFEQFVESQLDLLRLLLSRPQIQSAEPVPIRGAEETCSFTVRYNSGDERRLALQQLYVRRGSTGGSLAITTLESEAPAIQPVLDQIVRGLTFGKAGG